LNDKEEEMEVAMSKSNSMEQEISETKTFRKDLEAQLEDTFVEASQEHKPHESRENLSKQTEKTMNWISNEKDVQQYFEALVSKMTKESETEKNSKKTCLGCSKGQLLCHCHHTGRLPLHLTHGWTNLTRLSLGGVYPTKTVLPRQSQGPLKVDVQKGLGTPYKVYLKVQNIPVWRKDDKDLCIGKPTQPGVIVSQSCILEGDSFPLKYNLKTSSLLILTENEKEKRKLARFLEGLQSNLHKYRLKNHVVHIPLEAYDRILNSDICYGKSSKIAVGLKLSVYIIEITCDVIIQATVCKKVYHTELSLPKKKTTTLFCYWNSFVAGTAVEGSFDIKLPEIKGCLDILSSTRRKSSSTCLLVAVKCLIFCYEIHRTKPSHRQFNETVAPGTVQCMTMFKEKLCVGYSSGFSLLSIHEDGQCLSLVNNEEYLFCFSHMGLHVDSHQRSSMQELIWPSNYNYGMGPNNWSEKDKTTKLLMYHQTSSTSSGDVKGVRYLQKFQSKRDYNVGEQCLETQNEQQNYINLAIFN
ncbi:hypothetical protein EI555_002958, partial [Monodon monoceros]